MSTRELADAIAATARQQGETTPSVRGGDWRIAAVTAVAVTPGTVDCGTIRARRLTTYTAPVTGDVIAILRSGTGNWIALGRLA